MELGQHAVEFFVQAMIELFPDGVGQSIKAIRIHAIRSGFLGTPNPLIQVTERGLFVFVTTTTAETHYNRDERQGQEIQWQDDGSKKKGDELEMKVI